MTRNHRWVRDLISWAVVWLAIPVAGWIAMLALGPMRAPGEAGAGGVIAGLGIGAAMGWALRRPIAPWAVMSGIGLGLGSAVGQFAAGFFSAEFVQAIALALAGGIALATAQALLVPPVPPLVWVGLVAGGWTIGWAISLALAIDLDQGFVVFGATGALVFAALIGGVGMYATRRPRLEERIP